MTSRRAQQRERMPRSSGSSVRGKVALCGLINRRCREVLTIGVEKRVERQHSFPESSERRSRHWCDLDDAAGVIGHD